MTTSWPCSTSSRTPDGVSATRYSSVLISVGTPTFTWVPFGESRSDQLAPSQGEPEVDAVARRVQRAAGELLHPADAVTERVAVAVELPRGALPLPVAFDERLERAHQLAAVGSLTLLDGGEDRVAEQPERLVVLQREQQLEGAEVAVGRQPAALGAHAVLLHRGEPERLQRAARLVEGAAQLPAWDRAAGPGVDRVPDVLRHAGPQPLGQREQLLVPTAADRQQRAGEAAGPGGQAGR